MTETTKPLPDAVTNADEPLRLKCPQCGGGLNLKRRYLGIKGQCVHCHTPLTAVEDTAGIRVVCHSASVEEPAPVPATVSHASVPALSKATEAPAPVVTSFPGGEVSTPVESPAKETNSPSNWGFPGLDQSNPHDIFPTQESASPEASPSSFPSSHSPEVAPLLPGREEDNLFSGKVELPPAKPSSQTVQEITSPFGNSSESRSPFPSPFLNEPDKTEIQAAWGTQVPRENHASISPFSTGSAQGEGLGDSFFREKAVKESAPGSKEEASPFAASPFGASPFSSTPFAATAATPAPAPAQAAATPTGGASTETGDPSTPKRDTKEFVILDGDGRPMRPMSKEEEENFATNFFKYENARTKPTWVARLRKKLIRMLIFFCVVGALGAGASFFVPKETLVVWKDKVIKWLEPGMAIFDFLPDRFRPEWLPRTEFGIDAGTDENGQPKKKLNAFEGLEKLKGDVGDMRGAAEKQLEELNNF